MPCASAASANRSEALTVLLEPSVPSVMARCSRVVTEFKAESEVCSSAWMLPMLRRNWSSVEVWAAFCTSSAAPAGLSEGTLMRSPEASSWVSVLISCWLLPRAASRSGSGLGLTRINLGTLHRNHGLHHVVDGADDLRRSRVGLLEFGQVGCFLIERHAGNRRTLVVQLL